MTEKHRHSENASHPITPSSATHLPTHHIDVRLEARLRTLLESAPKNLSESIRYSLTAPGKRLRPLLAEASAHMLGLPTGAGQAIGDAIEMIHCYTLIHDDLPCLDNDDFRRGKPSNHKQFGEAVALLAGDALQPLAYETFFQLSLWTTQEQFSQAFNRFSTAIGPRGVIAGQVQELGLGAEPSDEVIAEVHALKTGCLFDAAILIPMDAAGVDEKSIPGKALATFSFCYGLAFQAADDLDDLKQDAAIKEGISLEKADARFRTCLSNLHKACDQLQEIWSERAQGLIKLVPWKLEN